jgi:hypothetical protein
MNYLETNKVVKAAAEYMAAQARLELQAKRSRTSVKATWKKVGDDWQPTSVRKTIIKKNFVATGNLFKSIKPIADNLEFGVSFAWYGQAIIDGRQPWGKFKGGKGIPVETMKRWTEIRRLRPRSAKGKFIGNSKNNKEAMQFMMNRKIKHFGIEPFDFIKMPRQVTMQKFKEQITQAVKKDILKSRL